MRSQREMKNMSAESGGKVILVVQWQRTCLTLLITHTETTTYYITSSLTKICIWSNKFNNGLELMDDSCCCIAEVKLSSS